MRHSRRTHPGRGNLASTARPSKDGTRTGEPLDSEADFDIPQVVSWTLDHYPASMEGTTAAKLADSAVAPVVALARGYRTITEETLTTDAGRLGMSTDRRRAQFKRLRKAVEGSGAMAMPWFSFRDVNLAWESGQDPESVVGQFRPDEVDVSGGGAKYEGPASTVLPMDVHPATDATELSGTMPVLMCEGLLKGDAALSAYLAAHHGADNLTVQEDTTRTEALILVRDLLANIPDEDRWLIVTFPSVTTWQQDASAWNGLATRDRNITIGFDADVAVNRNVWNQAARLWQLLERGRATPHLLRPTQRGDHGETSKAGIDDYLATGNTWEDLLDTGTDELPDRPTTRTDEKIGSWYVDKSGTSVYEVAVDPSAEGRSYHKPVVDLGGRILSIETTRMPGSEEMASGVLADEDAASTVNGTVQIQVSWEHDNTIHHATVHAPLAVLAMAPKEWVKAKALVPPDLLRHPSWPPDDRRWLSAVKANSIDEVERRVAWERMGWVPTESGRPAFMVGDHVLSADTVEDTVPARLELGGLRHASTFGVWDEETPLWDTPGYHQQVKRDLMALLDTYVHSGAWTRPGHASAVITSGLRPTIPLRPRVVLFVSGPSGRGKTWTAKVIMGFWEAHEEAWSDIQVPGNATDTMTFTEDAVSRAPIWVVDDWAPSQSKTHNEREGAKIGTLIRNVFNYTGRGRARADMSMQQTKMPNAVLIITAENEGGIASERQRYVPLHFGPGALHPDRSVTDAVNELHLRDGAPARVTAAMIRFMQKSNAVYGDWPSLLKEMSASRDMAEKEAITELTTTMDNKTNLSRAASVASEHLLVLTHLEQMAILVGVPKDYIDATFPKMRSDLLALVASATEDNSARTPGRSLIEGIRSALASGAGYIENSASPESPPYILDNDYQKQVNSVLGWKYEEQRPPSARGTRLGVMVYDDTDDPVILFEMNNTFRLAQETAPHLIPFGQTGNVSWSSVWDENLAFEGEGFVRRKSSSGKPMNTVRAGRNTVSGVPIKMSTILDSHLD